MNNLRNRSQSDRFPLIVDSVIFSPGRRSIVVKRRKEKRIHLIYYLLVFNKETEKLAGHVVDITTTGIKLMSREYFEPNNEFKFRIALPKEMDSSSKEVNFNAKSIWCKEKLYSDFYTTGFKIQDIPSKDKETIRWLINEFGYRN